MIRPVMRGRKHNEDPGNNSPALFYDADRGVVCYFGSFCSVSTN